MVDIGNPGGTKYSPWPNRKHAGRYDISLKVEIRSPCIIQYVLLNLDDTGWTGWWVYMKDICKSVLCRYDHDVPMNVYIPEITRSLRVSGCSFRRSHMSGRDISPSNRFIVFHARVDILFAPHRHPIHVWRRSSYRSVLYRSLQNRMRLGLTRVIGPRISHADLIPDGVSVSRFYAICKKGHILAFIMGAGGRKVKNFIMLR